MTSNAASGLSNVSLETVAPIERLPTELLQKIFKECTTLEDLFKDFHRINTYLPLPELNFTEPPLLFTRVSKRWKLTATSFPELWTSIRVSDSNLPYFYTPRRLELFCAVLEEWLGYTKSSPLHIVLHEGGPKRQMWDEIIPIFIKHLHRCVSLISSQTLTKMIFDQHVDMPMLHRCSIRAFQYDLAVKGLHIPPHITELSSCDLVHYSLLPPECAHELRHLELATCNDFTDILGMLRYFSELRTFRLKFCMNDEPGTEEVTHEHLEEVTLPATLISPDIMRRMHFPKMRIFRAWGMWYPERLQTLDDWLKDLGCVLDRLEVSGGMEGDMTEEDVGEMFESRARVRKVDFEKV